MANLTDFEKTLIEYATSLVANKVDKEYLTESVTFDDVTIVPTLLTEVSSRKDVKTSSTFLDIHGKSYSMFPVFGASMSFMWTRVAEELFKAGGLHILPRVEKTPEERLEAVKYLADSGIDFGFALGVKDSVEFVDEVLRHGRDRLKFLSVDVAHGASLSVANYMKLLREELGISHGLIVGNVGAPSGALFLEYVAEILGFKSIIIKVGVGPGAACTTRVKTGVGIGQISAIESVYNALGRQGDVASYIIADGGVEKPADFVKALAAKADGVMVGKYLTSFDFDGEFEYHDGKSYFTYYGMASQKAKKGAEDYVEGDVLRIPVTFKSIGEAVNSLEYGLRSAMTYTNSRNLLQFRFNSQLIRNSLAAVREGYSRGA